MKKSPDLPKQDRKKLFGNSSVTAISWAALLAMLCVICVSVLWEVFYKTNGQERSENKTYICPEFVLDFQAAVKEREELLQHYKSNIKTGIERRSNLSLQEFWDLYDAKWPVLITDVVKNWPASKWTTEFFNSTYGNEQVAMKAVKGTLADAQGLSVPLHLFVTHINTSTPTYWTYLEDELFIITRPELHQQILPSIYTEEDFFKLFPKDVRPWDSLLLWGTAYSRSSLHIDPYNWTGTNAVIKGTKKWKLFPPGQDHLLYVYPQAMCGFPLECRKYNSPVDTFAPNQQQYPLYNSAEYIEVEQKAGEMLIIPTGWFHQAYNAEETLALSGQIMNRNNYRYVLEEILKAGNLKRKRLPDGFHNLLPPDQVKIFMSLLPKKLLKKGRKWTQDYLDSIRNVAPAKKSAKCFSTAPAIAPNQCYQQGDDLVAGSDRAILFFNSCKNNFRQQLCRQYRRAPSVGRPQTIEITPTILPSCTKHARACPQRDRTKISSTPTHLLACAITLQELMWSNVRSTSYISAAFAALAVTL